MESGSNDTWLLNFNVTSSNYTLESLEDNENTTEASAKTNEGSPTIKDYDSYLNPFWTVLFSGSIITGTLGNLIVLWIVIGKV